MLFLDGAATSITGRRSWSRPSHQAEQVDLDEQLAASVHTRFPDAALEPNGLPNLQSETDRARHRLRAGILNRFTRTSLPSPPSADIASQT